MELEELELSSQEMSADRMIAMNPSGTVEMYENEEQDHQEQYQDEQEEHYEDQECEGGVCPIDHYSNENNMTSKNNWWIYLAIAILILIIAYFGYKYFVCKD